MDLFLLAYPCFVSDPTIPTLLNPSVFSVSLTASLFPSTIHPAYQPSNIFKTQLAAKQLASTRTLQQWARHALSRRALVTAVRRYAAQYRTTRAEAAERARREAEALEMVRLKAEEEEIMRKEKEERERQEVSSSDSVIYRVSIARSFPQKFWREISCRMQPKPFQIQRPKKRSFHECSYSCRSCRSYPSSHYLSS